MTHDDYLDASDALIDWLHSQQLSPRECMPVLSYTLIRLLYAIAMTNDKDPMEGAELISALLVETMHAMRKNK